MSLNELIELKNKIPKFKNNKKEEKEEKIQKLIFFKNIINNCEEIDNYMKILENKGIMLSIFINIQINYPKAIYKINNKEKTFNDIKEFLNNVLSNYYEQLDSFYLKNEYIRFLFGNLFKKLNMHLENKNNYIEDILRFVLNERDNNKKIKESDISIQKSDDNNLENYVNNIKNCFTMISNYISSVFNTNDIILQKNYEKILLKDKNKGIYLNICEKESIEQTILYLFICNKETSLEEIKAFLSRAILCDNNTLFSIAIYDSFSDSQKMSMFKYINKLLSYQNKKYNQKNKINVPKEKIKEYLNSCIFFVSEEKNKNILSLLDENNKYISTNKIKIKLNKNIELNKFLLNKVKIFTSDISGLGKTHKIKKIIKENNKQYYHISIGGKLTKEKIFTFLITNFYCTNGDILFIPFTNDIDIYIEIQNCFTNNYLSKFGILKLFDIINIKLDNIPKLDFPKTIIDTFKDKFGHIGLDTNEKIEEFIKNNIGIEKYSYYQINMFINFFLSQFNSYNGKVKFTKEGKDLTIQIIQDFSKGIQYFTKGCFSYLLLNKVNNQKEYIDLLSEIYSNDLDYMNFNIPIKIVLKEEMKFISLELKKNKLNNINQKDYLSRIKRMMNLKNEIDNDKDNNKSLLSILDYKTENYVITNDNFNKMILILYRIISNIPFIIMGETGCGKTLLLTKLNQLINNGELLLEKININPDITDQIIYEEMKRINEKYNNTKEEIWVFFDNINTCQSFELINEIFINRTFFGEKLNENIRIMGACNPFRKTKNEFNNCLAYNVHPLPQSLLYYVFSFGFMNNEDEKDYIYDMVEKLFNKNKEEELHKFTADSIFECHKFLRSIYDYSVVSLKDVNRFIKCVEFFKKYYKLKEDTPFIYVIILD